MNWLLEHQRHTCPDSRLEQAKGEHPGTINGEYRNDLQKLGAAAPSPWLDVRSNLLQPELERQADVGQAATDYGNVGAGIASSGCSNSSWGSKPSVASSCPPGKVLFLASPARHARPRRRPQHIPARRHASGHEPDLAVAGQVRRRARPDHAQAGHNW